MEARLTGINRQETLQYLSYRGEKLTDTVTADLDRCEETVLSTARPRAVWRLLPKDDRGFLPQGESVQSLLSDCHSMILFAATLGSEIDMLIRRAQHRNMSDALMLDAAASAAIENVCDNLCADLAQQLAPDHLTDRFSPGYGDFPLSQQADFFRILDIPRRIGVTLTESGLMVPQKTVTALIGVSTRPQPRRHRGCAYCNLFAECAYRKEGKRCAAE